MREEQSGGRRDEGRRRPGGTSLRRRRRRDNGTLLNREPQAERGARGESGGGGQAGGVGGELRAGTEPGFPPAAVAAACGEETRLHLLSPTTALRPMGAIAPRESLGSWPPHAKPVDTAASPGRLRALLDAARRPCSRGSGATDARARRGNAARAKPERGCRPAGARSGAGPAGGAGSRTAVGVTRAPPPIALRPGG